MKNAHPHVASAVVMVRPVDFMFNEQTASDNEFQHMPVDVRAESVNSSAMKEFEQSVQRLRDEGVNVVVLEGITKQSQRNKTPDAVFCNNWFTTHPNGDIYVYPLSTPNRREEVKRLDDLTALLTKNGYVINEIKRIAPEDEDQKFLESTGSMVFDHVNKIIYAARSIRMHDDLLEEWMNVHGEYRAVVFDTQSSHGLPFYHTNVMMSVGEKFAVVCLESICEKDRIRVLEELKKDREVIDISLEQAEQYFCGNILQLKSEKTGEMVIAMSESCLKGFTADQLEILKKNGKIVAFPISKTIEFVGGGSARCMLGEIFLPKHT